MNPTQLQPLPVGDNRSVKATVKRAGLPVNLTGYKAVFSWGLVNHGSPIGSKKNTAAGGGDTQLALLDAANGVLEVYLLASDTTTLTPFKTYNWSLTIEDTTGKEYTVAYGTIPTIGRVTVAIT